MVLSSIDTVKVILSDWCDTGDGTFIKIKTWKYMWRGTEIWKNVPTCAGYMYKTAIAIAKNMAPVGPRYALLVKLSCIVWYCKTLRNLAEICECVYDNSRLVFGPVKTV